MQIASFLAHYQIVYINFDLSSFFLISCAATVALSAFKCGSFASSESPGEKFGGLFRLFKAGRLIWLENFGRGVFVHIIHHHPAFFRDCLHRGCQCMPHTYIHVPIRISIGPFTPWSRRNAPAGSLPAHKNKTWEWEPTAPVCPQL